MQLSEYLKLADDNTYLSTSPNLIPISERSNYRATSKYAELLSLYACLHTRMCVIFGN